MPWLEPIYVDGGDEKIPSPAPPPPPDVERQECVRCRGMRRWLDEYGVCASLLCQNAKTEKE